MISINDDFMGLMVDEFYDCKDELAKVDITKSSSISNYSKSKSDFEKNYLNFHSFIGDIKVFHLDMQLLDEGIRTHYS